MNTFVLNINLLRRNFTYVTVTLYSKEIYSRYNYQDASIKDTREYRDISNNTRTLPTYASTIATQISKLEMQSISSVFLPTFHIFFD